MNLLNIKTSAFLPPLFFFLLPFLLCSCNGQSVTKKNVAHSTDQIEATAIGRVVTSIDPTIMNIYQAKNGDYWFGSKDQGIYKYKADEKGKKALTQYTTKDGLAGNRIRSIKEDKQGNIFIDCLTAINKYGGQKFKTLKVVPNQNNQWRLSPDDLWFEGDFNKNGVYRYDGENLQRMLLPKHDLEEEIHQLNPNGNSINIYDVYQTYKDRQGNIWIGAAVLGAMRFDGKNQRWLSDRNMTEIDPGPAPGVRSILEDRDGYFWFSSNINHKYKILPDDPKKGNSLNYEKSKGIDTSFDENLPFFFMALAEDNEGDIWLASYSSGVQRFDGEKLIHYPVQVDGIDVEIFTIYKDQQGGLWLGTFNAGPMKFNGKTFECFIP